MLGVNELVQIGTRIKELRIKKGLKQKELADRAKIPYSTFANYENNKREPNQEQIEKIATALGVPVYNLLGISTEQFLQPLKNETRFLDYLLSLGYEYVAFDDDDDFGFDGCIHIPTENIDIPLTETEYEYLKADIKSDVEDEIRRLKRSKNL